MKPKPTMEELLEEKERLLITGIIGKKPPSHLKQQIWQAIQQHEKFPILAEKLDLKWWNETCRPYQTSSVYENLYTQELLNTQSRSLHIVWAKKGIEEDEHPQFNESFFILEGTCSLFVEDKKYEYAVGDYIQIPDARHKVVVTSETPLKVLIERIKK